MGAARTAGRLLRSTRSARLALRSRRRSRRLAGAAATGIASTGSSCPSRCGTPLVAMAAQPKPFLTFGHVPTLDGIAPSGRFAAETRNRLAGADGAAVDGVLARPVKRARTRDGSVVGGDYTGAEFVVGAFVDGLLRRVDDRGYFAPSISAPPPHDSPMFRFVSRSEKVPLDWSALQRSFVSALTRQTPALSKPTSLSPAWPGRPTPRRSPTLPSSLWRRLTTCRGPRTSCRAWRAFRSTRLTRRCQSAGVISTRYPSFMAHR